MRASNQDNICDPDPFVKIMQRVWVRMAEIYSYEWTNRYGHKPSKGWLEILKDLTLNEIRFGFEQLVKTNKYKDRPPTPIAFKELCKPSYDCAAPPKEFYKSLDAPEIKPMSKECRAELNDFYKKMGWNKLIKEEVENDSLKKKAA